MKCLFSLSVTCFVQMKGSFSTIKYNLHLLFSILETLLVSAPVIYHHFLAHFQDNLVFIDTNAVTDIRISSIKLRDTCVALVFTTK